jgi:putative peptidoglycan lipid II flippase
VLRGTVITTVALGFGTVLGLLRDLMIAGFFGATGQTDAFLVAWTLPETAVPLLIDGAMTLLMIPILSRALERRDGQRARPAEDHLPDPVATAVASTMPQMVAALAVLSGVVALTAPWLITVLAPGLKDPALGVSAMRIIAVSVLFIGIAGYMVAALRSHLVYGPPAMITTAMNVGIIGCMLALHQRIGVLSAVVGAAVGSALMVAVQVPAFMRRVGLPRRVLRGGGMAFAAFVPIAGYILARQAQVFVERFVASSLAPGTITQLNYAQKIAQVPSILALILAVVSFPQLARHVVSGQTEQARRRTLTDVQIIGAIVLAATAFLIAFAPQVVALLLQRGAFTARDTMLTADILRIYVLGLLGQAVLDISCRAVFSERASLVPATSMLIGLAVTAAGSAVGAALWGGPGIAAANALGITAAALLVVCNRRSRVIPASRVGLVLLRLMPAALLSTVFAWWLAGVLHRIPAAVSVFPSVALVAVVFGVLAVLTRGLPPPRRFLRARSSIEGGPDAG